MYSQVKESLASVRKEMANLKGIEDSILLVKFFHDLKNLLTYCNTEKIEIYQKENEKNFGLKYVMSYRLGVDSGKVCKDTLFSNLRLSRAELKEPEYSQEFERVIAIVEKEKVKLEIITEQTTVEHFMKQFDVRHAINYLKYCLELELQPNNQVRYSNMKV